MPPHWCVEKVWQGSIIFVGAREPRDKKGKRGRFWIKREREDIAVAPWEKKKDEDGKDPQCGLNIDSI